MYIYKTSYPYCSLIIAGSYEGLLKHYHYKVCKIHTMEEANLLIKNTHTLSKDVAIKELYERGDEYGHPMSIATATQWVEWALDDDGPTMLTSDVG